MHLAIQVSQILFQLQRHKSFAFVNVLSSTERILYHATVTSSIAVANCVWCFQIKGHPINYTRVFVNMRHKYLCINNRPWPKKGGTKVFSFVVLYFFVQNPSLQNNTKTANVCVLTNIGIILNKEVPGYVGLLAIPFTLDHIHSDPFEYQSQYHRIKKDQFTLNVFQSMLIFTKYVQKHETLAVSVKWL